MIRYKTNKILEAILKLFHYFISTMISFIGYNITQKKILTTSHTFREKLFILKIERDSTGIWKLWTFGTGTEDEMSKFLFKIRLFKDKLSVNWEAQVISIDKPSAEVLQQNGILSIDNDFLRRLCTVDVKDENYYRLDYDFEDLEI